MNTNKFMLDVIAAFPNSATATHKSEREKVSKFAAGLTDQQRASLFEHLTKLEKDHEVNAAVCRQWFADAKAASRTTASNAWGDDPNVWKNRVLYPDTPEALVEWNWVKGFLRGQDLWEAFCGAELEQKVYMMRLFDVLRYDHGTLRTQLLLDAAGVGEPRDRWTNLFWHAREMPRCQTQGRDGWKINGGEGYVRKRRQSTATVFTEEEQVERADRYRAAVFDPDGNLKDFSSIIHSDEIHALTHEWNVAHPNDPMPTDHLPGYRGR
jgi:hypothetical protein